MPKIIIGCDNFRCDHQLNRLNETNRSNAFLVISADIRQIIGMVNNHLNRSWFAIIFTVEVNEIDRKRILIEALIVAFVEENWFIDVKIIGDPKNISLSFEASVFVYLRREVVNASVKVYVEAQSILRPNLLKFNTFVSPNSTLVFEPLFPYQSFDFF